MPSIADLIAQTETQILRLQDRLATLREVERLTAAGTPSAASYSGMGPAAAVKAYLAAHGGSATKEELKDALWRDVECAADTEPLRRRAIEQALFALRRRGAIKVAKRTVRIV